MDVPKIVDALMDRLGVNQSGLAKALGGGITQPQISRWRKGPIPEVPSYDRLKRLAEHEGLFDMRSEDVAASLDRPPERTVKLKGYVGAGGRAHYYALADEDFEEVPAPTGATDQTVAVEIKGTSLGPLLDTWLVFYKDVRSPVESDMLGQLCVVGLADDRILIKKIQSNGRGGFNLISNSADPPIKDAKIEWAAKVTDMRPR